MATFASNEVGEAFDRAQSYAASAEAQLQDFLTLLQSDEPLVPTTLDATWQTPAQPTFPAIPEVPAFPDVTINEVSQPSPFSESIPDIVISEFTEPMPSPDFGVAPVLSYGTAPTLPEVAEIALPDAPVIDTVAVPTFLTLEAVTFAGVDLREDWLQNLETLPTLEILEPAPYSYSRGADYVSQLMTALKGKLNARLDGGTGLDPAVEQAIWDRARDREANTALANQNEVLRQSGALGFRLPAGVIAAQVREAQQNYYNKVSELSREIGIEQAKLEQANLKDAIEQGIALEQQLLEHSYKLEQLTFEAAKNYADNAIALHNAKVDAFKALLAGYETYAATYKIIIDGELSKVEVFKAQLEAERSKAQINESLVARYKAQIEAQMAYVEIYRARVDASKTLVQIEEAKISAGAEQVRAYTAQVNAETAKVDAYKAKVQAGAVEVEAYAAKAKAYEATVSAQAERARANVSRYTALAQAKTAEWEGFRARVAAETSRVEALTSQSALRLDAFRAEVAAVEAQANVTAKIWDTSIQQYATSKQYALEVAKANRDALQDNREARLEAGKVGAQVFAQLTASAYGMINASASISEGYSTSTSTSSSTSTNIAL